MRFLSTLLACTTVAQVAGAAHAAPVAITNPSFEQGALADGGFAFEAPAGWTRQGNAGYQNPSAAVFSSVPEGEHTGFIGSGVAGAIITGSLSQVVAQNVAANTRYTLSAMIGRRADIDLSNFTFGLMVGNGFVAAGSFTNDNIAPGVFRKLTVEFTSTAATALPLSINIQTLLSGIEYRQVNIDDVRLDASPLSGPVETPEPGALALLGLGVLGVAASRRRGR